VNTKAPTATAPVELIISSDRLVARLRVRDRAQLLRHPPSETELLALLEKRGIELTDNVRQRIQQFIDLCSADNAGQPGKIPEEYLVAEGTAPTEPQDETICWSETLVPTAAPDDVGHVDWYRRSVIRAVTPNTVVGILQPATEGVPGRDVFGQPVSPRRSRGNPLRLGPGLRLDDNSRQIIATAAGCVFLENGKLRLEQNLEIPGDVDFESGSIDVCTDVHVGGTIRANFSVRTAGSLTVDRAIEAAEICAGGDLSVRGGICGRLDGPAIRVGGSISARFCNECNIKAGKDLRFERELINSQVQATRVLSRTGTIIGGYVWAREALEVATLGSEAAVTTRVALGLSVEVLRRMRQLELQAREHRKLAQQIRQRVEPLMANLKRLTHQQREVATELLARADELDAEVERLLAEREKLRQQAQPSEAPYLMAHVMIYPGVLVSIDGQETRFDQPLAGPVRIERRRLEGVAEIVAVRPRTGSVTVLPSYELDLKPAPTPGKSEEDHADASQNPT
jgi:uncharacterized protein (DUF342 family)